MTTSTTLRTCQDVRLPSNALAITKATAACAPPNNGRCGEGDAADPTAHRSRRCSRISGPAMQLIQGGEGESPPSSVDTVLPLELRVPTGTAPAVWASRMLALFGEAHASEEYNPTDGFTFAGGIQSIAVAGPVLTCRLDRPATCYTQQWFFAAMGLRAVFRCTPVAGGGAFGVGVLPHEQRPASGEHLLGTAGFPGSVGCLVLGGDVWVTSGGRAVQKQPLSTGSAASADPVAITLEVSAGKVVFEVGGRRFDVALPAGVAQFRLGASMDRFEQQVQLLSCGALTDSVNFTFSNRHCHSITGEHPRFQCVQSKGATLYSYQTFRGGDSVRLKVRVTPHGGEAVGIGVLYADQLNDCAFRSLGDKCLNGSVGLLIDRGELIVRWLGADYVVQLPPGVALTAPVVLALGYVDGRLECAVEGAVIELPHQLTDRLQLRRDHTFRFGITLSEADQSVEVVAAHGSSSCLDAPPISAIRASGSGGGVGVAASAGSVCGSITVGGGAHDRGSSDEDDGSARIPNRNFASSSSFFNVDVEKFASRPSAFFRCHFKAEGNERTADHTGSFMRTLLSSMAGTLRSAVRFCCKKAAGTISSASNSQEEEDCSSKECIPPITTQQQRYPYDESAVDENDDDDELLKMVDRPTTCAPGLEYVASLEDVFWEDRQEGAEVQLVTARAKGRSLVAEIKEWQSGRPFEYRLHVAKKWIRQLLLAVQVFEACSLVHNDLKPHSIIVINGEVGNTGDVRIVDFGLCASHRGTKNNACNDVRSVTSVALQLVAGSDDVGDVDWKRLQREATLIDDEFRVRFPEASRPVMDDLKLFRSFLDGGLRVESNATTALKHPWLAAVSPPTSPAASFRRNIMEFVRKADTRSRWPWIVAK